MGAKLCSPTAIGFPSEDRLSLLSSNSGIFSSIFQLLGTSIMLDPKTSFPFPFSLMTDALLSGSTVCDFNSGACACASAEPTRSCVLRELARLEVEREEPRRWRQRMIGTTIKTTKKTSAMPPNTPSTTWPVSPLLVFSTTEPSGDTVIT